MLTFEPDTHTYRDQAGRLVPGVTSVLEPLNLVAFNDPAWIDPQVLERARQFGSHVHLACHLSNMGELDEDTLDPALAQYLIQWKAFLADTGMRLTHSEEMVHNVTVGYAGQADAIGLLQKKSYLIDLKTGQVPWTVGFQTAAYQQACIERPRRRLCVQLSGAGYRATELKDTGDYQIFLSALNIFKARARKRTPVNISEYA